MKKEKAKELSNILLNYAEGKIIQRFICNNWHDLSELSASDLTSFDLGGKYYPLRVKPKPKLVPFAFEDKDLFKDKWFRLKTTSGLFKASYIDENLITIGASQNSYSELMQLFEFEDGSPCGKYIE